MTTQIKLSLDKPERNLLAKIKKNNPAYSDLKIQEIAHLELKSRLVEVLKKALFGFWTHNLNVSSLW